MPNASDFVGRQLTANIVVVPNATIDLAGGSIQDTAVELQQEINETNEAADVVLAVFENSLL